MCINKLYNICLLYLIKTISGKIFFYSTQGYGIWDLAQDYIFRKEKKETQDKYLLSLLVAPLFNHEQVLKGKHFSELELNMQIFNSETQTNNLIHNEIPRYHYLEFPSDIPIIPSVIDFKHYFTANREYLSRIKNTNFICKVSELYREDISQRFASFLSRIGLPSEEKLQKTK